MRNNVYVPEYETGECVVIQNSDVIRKYDEEPIENGTYHYTDYYVNQDYQWNEGYQTFNQYTTRPTCRTITTNIMEKPNNEVYICSIILIIILAVNLNISIIRRWIRE